MYLPFFMVTIFVSNFVMPIVGAMILSVGWTLAPLFLMNKETSFIEALRSSWRATYGHKWLIFGIVVVYMLVAGIVMGLSIGLVALLFGALVESSFGAALAVAILFGLVAYGVYMLVLSVGIGISGSIWKQLVGNVEE
jgi:membrane-anchored glycerophosphoryl diester phosphodiesterase (GDPDase)